MSISSIAESLLITFIKTKIGGYYTIESQILLSDELMVFSDLRRGYMMENDSTLKESVYNQILKTNDVKGVYELFNILGYPENSILEPSSKRKKSTFEFKKEDNERINEIYSVLNMEGKLPVFLLETATLTPSFIRSVTNTFDGQYIKYLLVFTTNYNEIVFVFPDKEKIGVGKHKLKLIKLNVNKEDIRTKKIFYSVIETLANLRYENRNTWREVWAKWKKAFSVERVTKAFFDDYKEVFFKLRSELRNQISTFSLSSMGSKMR